MNKKLVAFDIDGTLLTHDKQLPDSTRKAIATLHERGVEVAIATGRPPFMMGELRKELNIESYVSTNGQLVVYKGEKVYENPIKPEIFEKLLIDAAEKDFPVAFQGENGMRVNAIDHAGVADAIGSLKLAYPDFDEAFYKNNTIYQGLLFCEEGEEDFFAEKYKEHLRFVRWHKYSVDIVPIGGSKAKGLEILMNKMGVENKNMYAFGDGLNDMEMMTFAENAVVMGNGVEPLKKLATFVTKDVDDDGILHGLKWAGLL